MLFMYFVCICVVVFDVLCCVAVSYRYNYQKLFDRQIKIVCLDWRPRNGDTSFFFWFHAETETRFYLCSSVNFYYTYGIEHVLYTIFNSQKLVHFLQQQKKQFTSSLAAIWRSTLNLFCFCFLVVSIFTISIYVLCYVILCCYDKMKLLA